uniref:Uncharacterized protein n=1 Tax=Myotis myotis TaxID=51298 RepID=A0A7J7WHS1_MYOMY|nr:hypothetical protein mMyoMyo1_012113 [Myotis myotis]
MNQEVMVRFLVRAYAQVVGSIPTEGHAGSSRSTILYHHRCFYLFLPLSSSLKSIKMYFKKRNCNFKLARKLVGCSPKRGFLIVVSAFIYLVTGKFTSGSFSKRQINMESKDMSSLLSARKWFLFLK